MRFFILAIVLFLNSPVMASTFVGNGGNAGDVELQMTLGQLEETFHFVNRDKAEEGSNLCKCTESYEGRPLCDIVKQLNEEQVRFCAKFLQDNAAELKRILNTKDQVNYSWTHQSIDVRENGSLRAADAVTDAGTKTMILNQDRFLQMDEDEKVFLVGHELFHLISFEGKPLADEGNIGPFKGTSAGRTFINAMAASVVMQAHKYSVFNTYKDAVRRSKSYKENWIDIGSVSITMPNDATTSLDMPTMKGVQIAYRRQFTQGFGGLVQMASVDGEKSILSATKAKETRNIVGVGAAYRWFPLNNPLTFWGQAHFVVSGTADFVSGKYEIQDTLVGATATATAAGYTARLNYYIPFNDGLWAYAGVAHTSYRLAYDLPNDTRLEYKNNGSGFYLGATYGF